MGSIPTRSQFFSITLFLFFPSFFPLLHFFPLLFSPPLMPSSPFPLPFFLFSFSYSFPIPFVSFSSSCFLFSPFLLLFFLSFLKSILCYRISNWLNTFHPPPPSVLTKTLNIIAAKITSFTVTQTNFCF